MLYTVYMIRLKSVRQDKCRVQTMRRLGVMDIFDLRAVVQKATRYAKHYSGSDNLIMS